MRMKERSPEQTGGSRDAARSPGVGFQARNSATAPFTRSRVLPRRAGLVWIMVALLLPFGCSRPLPENDSVQARVYVSECGMCHPPIHPRVMTSAMWRIQVERMDELRARRGLPALSAGHRNLILEYLDRNAG